MLSVHGPVIVNVIDNRCWDLYNSVLFFGIEYVQRFFLIEDRLFRRRLLLALLILSIIIIILIGDGLTFLNSPLSIHILGVSFDRFLIFFFPCELSVHEVVFTTLLSVLLLLDLRLAVFFGASCGNLAPSYVDFSA